ncbi:ORF26 [Silurid herpesvirus 1]|nr:ORF26 [Silurid herpesvirus 1]
MQFLRKTCGANTDVSNKFTAPQKGTRNGIHPEEMTLLTMINWPLVDREVELPVIEALMTFEGPRPPTAPPGLNGIGNYLIREWIPWFIDNCEPPSNTDLFILATKTRADRLVLAASIITTLTCTLPHQQLEARCRLKLY